jgi:hypothetical protein
VVSTLVVTLWGHVLDYPVTWAASQLPGKVVEVLSVLGPTQMAIKQALTSFVAELITPFAAKCDKQKISESG